jgi:hypothetical protein
MARAFLITLILATAAQAQEPVRLRSESSLYRAPIRMRPANDTTTEWTYGVARTVDALTYEVVDARGRTIRMSTRNLIVQADDPHEVRWRQIKWTAGIGAVAAAASMVGYAATCRNSSGEGPGCGIVYVFVPAAAGIGGSVGALIGSLLPVHPWRRVKVVK